MDHNIIRVPCLTKKLRDILSFEQTSGGCTINMPGRGHKNILLIVLRAAQLYSVFPQASEASINTSRPVSGPKHFSVGRRQHCW